MPNYLNRIIYLTEEQKTQLFNNPNIAQTINGQSIQYNANDLYITNNTNADTATAFASAQPITLTGNVTGTVSSTGGWTIPTTLGAGVVTNDMLTGNIASNKLAGNIPNNKLANSQITIAGQIISLGSSLTADTLITALGLSSAMKYKGSVSELPAATATNTYSTYNAGDVITISNGGKEYVYNKGENAASSSWIELGDESSYKIKQTAVTDPSVYNSATATAFISTISQNANGEITVEKANLPSASSSIAGITKLGASGGAAAYSHNHSAENITSGTLNTDRLPNDVVKKRASFTSGMVELDLLKLNPGIYDHTVNPNELLPTAYGTILNIRGLYKYGSLIAAESNNAFYYHTYYYNTDTDYLWRGSWQMVAHADAGTAQGSNNIPIYINNKGEIQTCSTYAGGTAITLNNASKAATTASFYAPTTGGTANTQALIGDGATTAPKWVNISPSITIGAGTSSAAPTINVTVLGQSGTAKSITTASTSVYGVTILQDGISSTSTALAATANAAYTASRNSLHTLATTTKYYVTGSTSNITNTADDSFDTGVYVTTTAGELSAVRHTLNVSGTDKAYMIYNNTDNSIDFIFN